VAKLTEGNSKYDGRKNTRLYYLFKEISSYINYTALPAVRSNDDKRAKILLKMYNYYTQLKELVNDPSINMGTTGKILHFSKFAKGYGGDNLIGKAQSGDQLWLRILKAPPVKTGDNLITAYEYFIKNFLGPVDWLRGILQQKVMGGSLANLVRSPTIKALVAMEKLKYIISKINMRISELEKFKTGGIFSDADDGSAIKANILLGFKEIEATVYGKVGASFLTYVSKNGNKSIKNYLGHVKNLIKDDTIKSVNNKKCPEANKIMTEYGIAESLTNMGYDFLAINMDSFFEPRKFYSYLRWKSAWHQRHIQNHVKSIKSFRQKYGQQKQIPLSDKNKFKAILYTPMGSLMFRIKQSQMNLGKIQSYVEKARCKGRRDAKLKLSF
jgi:hypothetical protein